MDTESLTGIIMCSPVLNSTMSRIAAGRYLRLKIAEHQKLALTVKLIWSTLWMKSGNSAPPHRILVDCREDPLTLLIPAR